ncbi:MAG: SRPBCC domain-containing protein [Candidatus Rokubacteria bacterium]|nr:SRPBCC domain-containing protein [Candidatus Rokubacteria bacterium]
MKTLETAIDEVLTDFPAYPAWNPFIRRIAGAARPGARLAVHIQPAGGRGMTFRPTVLVAEPDRELRWRGRLLVPGLLDGEHAFVIEPRGDGGVR